MLTFLLTVVLTQVPPSHAHDLVVEARLKSPARVTVGEPITVDMRLVNRGRQALAVVKPGDGSESNWREPYVYFSAERHDGRGWVALPKMMIARCGLFDFDWVKDITTLAPGRALVLRDWVDTPSHSVSLDQPGRYRLRVHYAYGTATRSTATDRGAMRDVLPFEVTSAPIELELVR